MIKAGTWVDIERVLLEPAARATTLPEDTARTPYVLRISGFLEQDAEPGTSVTVRSLIGHVHAGVLRAEMPSYTHSFGATVPELLTIGLEKEV